FLAIFLAHPFHMFLTLSLHDALPISPGLKGSADMSTCASRRCLGLIYLGWVPICPRCSLSLSILPSPGSQPALRVNSAGRNSYPDRKSTRLNSSHLVISYAVFCLKKK